jgi:tripartite-type tricarboxylate transporter receptor subunit TctC
VAAAAVARAEPDGSTFMMNSLATHGIAPALYKLPFDPDRDVTAIALLVQMPNVLYVRSDFSAANLQQLLEFGRRNPGKLSYSSAGQGTTLHLSGARLAAATGIDMLHVPYNGAAPAVQAVLRGEVTFAFENIGAVVGQIRGGLLRPLAVTAATRSVQLPDVPTMAEAGMNGFEIATWFGIVGPGGVPKPIVERFGLALERVMHQADTVERAARLGAELRFLNATAFEAFMRQERAQWRGAVQAAGIKVE